MPQPAKTLHTSAEQLGNAAQPVWTHAMLHNSAHSADPCSCSTHVYCLLVLLDLPSHVPFPTWALSHRTPWVPVPQTLGRRAPQSESPLLPERHRPASGREPILSPTFRRSSPCIDSTPLTSRSPRWPHLSSCACSSEPRRACTGATSSMSALSLTRRRHWRNLGLLLGFRFLLPELLAPCTVQVLVA